MGCMHACMYMHNCMCIYMYREEGHLLGHAQSARRRDVAPLGDVLGVLRPQPPQLGRREVSVRGGAGREGDLEPAGVRVGVDVVRELAELLEDLALLGGERHVGDAARGGAEDGGVPVRRCEKV